MVSEKLCWNVLVLLGGGFAIAAACQVCSLAIRVKNTDSILLTLLIICIIEILSKSLMIIVDYLIKNIRMVLFNLRVIWFFKHK